MTKRQILIYQKNESRPILITSESDLDDEKFESDMEQIFKSKVVTKIKTDMDTVLIRPSEVSSILISKREDLESLSPKKKSPYMSELKGKPGEAK